MIILAQFVEKWRRRGALPAPGATGADIASFESRWGVKLPPNFREYLMLANGTEPPQDTDADGFAFWSLKMIRPITENLPSAAEFEGAIQYFVFADYLGWSWAYAIRLSSNPADHNPISIVGTKTGAPQALAGSFSEFVAMYLEGWERISPTT